MGDFPTHGCVAVFDGEQIPVVSPMSMLDCEREPCRVRANAARRGIHYELGYIESRVEQERMYLQNAADRVAFWELVLEAKRRELEDK